MARCMLVLDTQFSPCTIKDDRANFSGIEIRRAISSSDKNTIVKLIEGLNAADIRVHKHCTLLHMAIKIGNSEMIQFFIDKGCDVNAQDRNGATPLLVAIKFSRWRAVSKLLKEKANLFLADNGGINALKLALHDQENNRPRLINLLTEHLQVCGLNGKELAPSILEAGWPLRYAIDIRNSELIKLMIEAGCSVNSRDECTENMTALHKAIFNGDLECTKILLQYGANIDIRNVVYQSPFMQATTIYPCTNVEIFEIFLKLGLQRFNKDGMIYSYKSFCRANAQIIKLLAKYKVNLTKKDGRGSTILHNLVRNIDPEVTNLISKTEIDVNHKDIKGNTALHFAVIDSSINCLEALICKGADVNAKNENSRTPLTNAVYHRESEKVIEILLKNGAILDEEIQNHILNDIIDLNKPTSNIRPILKQMAIMHLKSEAVSERNKHLIKFNYRIHYLYKLYCRELDSMKQKYVTANCHISLFDILCGSEYQLSYYVRNKEIVKNFLEIQICNRYPGYGEYITSRFERACIKQNLVQKAIDVLSNNIKQLSSNLEILENIVTFLSFGELAILCKC